MLGSTDAGTGNSPNGDRTTPMGNGTATCYNTPNLHKLGWIKPQVFCDGGTGDSNYDAGYGEDDDSNDGDYPVVSLGQGVKQAPQKHPKAEHREDDHEDDNEDDHNDDGDDSTEDGDQCQPLAVGDVQQISLAMTVYGGDIQNPPQPGCVGARFEPWDANQLPLYLGYVSAKGTKAVVMNGLPMGLRRKTAIYTYVWVFFFQ